MGWGPINRGTWADHYADEVGERGDSGNAARIATLLSSGDPDVIFWQISAVDSAGHAGGFSPTNPDYLKAITTADGYYGTVLTALRQRPGYIDGSEEWLILTVTDHGGYGTSHHLPTSGHDLEVQQTFFIATGSGVVPGANLGQPRVYDVAVTTMAHMGIETAGLNLDGVVVPPEPTTRWRPEGGGNFSAQSNWTAGVPNGFGYVANYGASITADQAITLDVAVTHGELNFDSGHNYTLAGNNGLTMKAAGTGMARIGVVQSGGGGGHVIAVPVILASPLDVSVGAGAAITFAGGISNPSGLSMSKSGPGLASIDGPQAHGAGATLAVNEGMLVMNTDAGGGSSAELTMAVSEGALAIMKSTQHLKELRVAGRCAATGRAGGADRRGETEDGRRGAGSDRWKHDCALGGGGEGGRAGGGLGADQARAEQRSGPVAGEGDHQLGGGKRCEEADGAGGDPERLGTAGAIYGHVRRADGGWNSILVKYTWNGDMDLSGKVDADDYFLIDTGFLSGGELSGYRNGDLDYQREGRCG